MRTKDEAYCTIGFRDVKLRLIGIPLFAFIMPIAFFDANPFNGGQTFLIEFVITFLHTLVFWHTDRGVVILFRKYYPYYSQYKKRLIWQMTTVVILTLLLQFISLAFLTDVVWHQYLNDATQPAPGQFFIATLFVTATVMAIYESMYAFDMWSIGITQNERLKKENATAQLETLKSQVNPHFLFNSLNTLAALIPENPAIAVEFVEKLSKVYRFILEIRDKQFIPLQEELKALDAYQFLLKMRFGDNIQFIREIDEKSTHLSVIPLSIQMLMENAVKHNIISKSKPLLIKIYIEDDFVVVENNLQTKKLIQSSTKTGLINIHKRYALLSNKEPIFLSDQGTFIVKLPLIPIS